MPFEELALTLNGKKRKIKRDGEWSLGLITIILVLVILRRMKWLWTWHDNPDVPIPNTNNILEAINTDLKTKLRVHNGMSKRYRRLFIDEYFRLKYK